MRYLVDTDVISELRKRDRCDSAVNLWKREELVPYRGAISVIVLGEIRKGIDIVARRDPTTASRLELWLQGLCEQFGDRILPVTREIAVEWGRLNAQRPLPAADSLLAATANVHDLVLATRNTDDLRDVDVRLMNPFEYPTA